MNDDTFFSNRNIAVVLLVPHSIFSIIATGFVGLRLYTTKVITNQSTWTVDVYLCILALVSSGPPSRDCK